MIGPADHRAEGNHQDVNELVALVGSLAPWIIEFGEVLGNRIEQNIGHERF